MFFQALFIQLDFGIFIDLINKLSKQNIDDINDLLLIDLFVLTIDIVF